MTITVKELAKELSLNSAQLVEKMKELNIKVKDRQSEVSEENAEAVRKVMSNNKAKVETKIVRTTAKKVAEPQDEPKVVVKPAEKVTASPVMNRAKAQEPVKKQEKQEKAPATMKPPVGKPIMKDEDGVKVKPPVGTPVIPEFDKVVAEEKTVKAEIEAPVEKQEAADNIKRQPEPEKEQPQQIKILKKFDPEAERLAKEAERKRIQEQKKERETRDSRPRRTKEEGNRGEGRNAGSGSENKGSRFGNRSERNERGERHDRNDKNAGSHQGYRDKQHGRVNRDAHDKDKDDYHENRNRGGDRKQSSRGEKSEIGPMVSKPQIKRDEKGKEKNKDKDRDKFSKLEKGTKGKQVKSNRSLEKAPKPKKHQSKPKQVEEPDMLDTLPVGTKVINVPITVAGFCEQMEISTSSVIMKLMKLGIMANINQNIDEDTVLILADEMGVEVVIGKVQEVEIEEGIENFEDREEDLKVRPPIVTVMGHVDHGKTSLLDAIRKTNVTAFESGGITQHIGASEVTINGQKIVFLDTPGHEAFTAMRARGAHGADIAILVVAADDSVKPQTVESISHAKAAGVPIIVAINKIDKPGANIERVKQDLTEHGLLVEDWGGDTIAVPVSAKAGEGIVNLLEMVLLQAEVMELKANPNRLAMGTVIEARLDKAKGPVASLLVTNGTLHSGMSVVAGTSAGRIRLMTNFKGDTIKKAGPATAVEILGLTDVPEAGDIFHAVREDKVAREIAESRKLKLREEVLAKNSSTTLEELFSQIQEGEIKELNLIIKGDVQGSVGALEASLEKLKNENVRVKIIHSGVGTVTESDVMLASTSGAVIIGFNVRPSTAVSTMAERDGVEIRTYRIIYDVIDDVESAMKGMLEPEFKEEVLGKVEVRTTFKVPNVGTIAGAYVLEGKVVRNANIRLVRDGIVYHEGKISSLKRFKDDAKEVQHGYECGIGFENYNDLKEGDIIECFHMVEVERK